MRRHITKNGEEQRLSSPTSIRTSSMRISAQIISTPLPGQRRHVLQDGASLPTLLILETPQDPARCNKPTKKKSPRHQKEGYVGISARQGPQKHSCRLSRNINGPREGWRTLQKTRHYRTPFVVFLSLEKYGFRSFFTFSAKNHLCWRWEVLEVRGEGGCAFRKLRPIWTTEIIGEEIPKNQPNT